MGFLRVAGRSKRLLPAFLNSNLIQIFRSNSSDQTAEKFFRETTTHVEAISSHAQISRFLPRLQVKSFDHGGRKSMRSNVEYLSRLAIKLNLARLELGCSS